MAALTVVTSARAGVDPGFVACAGGGDDFENAAGDTLIHVNNGDASDMTLTIVTHRTIDGLAVADRAETVPAGEERIFGPFPAATYNDPATGLVSLTYSAVTSLTIAAFVKGA